MRLIFILETRNLIHLVKKTTNADDKIAIYLFILEKRNLINLSS